MLKIVHDRGQQCSEQIRQNQVWPVTSLRPTISGPPVNCKGKIKEGKILLS